MGGLSDVIENDLIPLVAKSAPLLATALGSPLAGIALSLIGSALGVDTAKTGALASILQSDPTASAKLQELEYAHGEQLAQIAATKYATEVDDRKDARKYGVQYKDFICHMAYLVTIGFFCALFALFLPLQLNEVERSLLSMLVGMLASKWQTIIDFFFGSSRHNNQSQGATNGRN